MSCLTGLNKTNKEGAMSILEQIAKEKVQKWLNCYSTEEVECLIIMEHEQVAQDLMWKYYRKLTEKEEL